MMGHDSDWTVPRILSSSSWCWIDRRGPSICSRIQNRKKGLIELCSRLLTSPSPVMATTLKAAASPLMDMMTLQARQSRGLYLLSGWVSSVSAPCLTLLSESGGGCVGLCSRCRRTSSGWRTSGMTVRHTHWDHMSSENAFRSSCWGSATPRLSGTSWILRFICW